MLVKTILRIALLSALLLISFNISVENVGAQDVLSFSCEGNGNLLVIYLFPSTVSDWEEHVHFISNIACDVNDFWMSFGLGEVYSPPSYILHEFSGITPPIYAGNRQECEQPPPKGVYAAYYCADALDAPTVNHGIILNRDVVLEAFRNFGPIAIADTLGHEWGHHIQWILLEDNATPELEADCYSGAYIRYAIDNPDRTRVDFTEADWRTFQQNLLEKSNQLVDSSEEASTWEGITYGQRHDAILEGFNNGITACIELPLDDVRMEIEPLAEEIEVPPDNLLDLIFVIDTTSSMEDDIDAVKREAVNVINAVAASGNDWRIGIVTYRDQPISPYGEPGDYVSRVETGFSIDQGAITTAINGITVAGGGDAREAVFSGLMTAIEFPWRDGAQKVIILMGDAPPHDPEPVTGFSRDSTLQAAFNVDPANVFPILIENNEDTRAAFQALADGSSGRLFNAQSSAEVVDTILATIGSVTGDPILAQLLTVGDRARVRVYADGLSLRTAPNNAAPIIENIPSGEVVTITSEPQYSDSLIWWGVQTANGNEGFAVEAADGITTLIPLAEGESGPEKVCTLVTLQGVNLRTGPGTEFRQPASRDAGVELFGEAQAVGSDGFIWWRTFETLWVRSDLVREFGDCDSLPIVE
ncbi:MAG: VWA domain-containing protein [Chloroflexi bacterium]|nr:MAG: hypothetical protein CUN54_06285 [Phototrophicales bacterium]RMF81844.1 MAG: VWA domain-containing protein [Chloroflexota bacterium]